MACHPTLIADRRIKGRTLFFRKEHEGPSGNISEGSSLLFCQRMICWQNGIEPIDCQRLAA